MRALLFIAIGLTLLFAAHHAGEPRSPLMVQAALPTGDAAAANRLYAPCPLAPQNLPLTDERTA